MLTTSGIYGRIARLGEDDADLEIAPGTVIHVARGAIGQRIEPESAAAGRRAARRRDRGGLNRAPQGHPARRDGRLILGAFVATVLGDSRPVLGLDLQGGISIVLVPVKGSDLSTLNTAVDDHPQPRRRPRHRRARRAAARATTSSSTCPA